MILRRLLVPLLATTALFLAPTLGAQTATGSGTSTQSDQKSASPPAQAPTHVEPATVYHRPTEREKLRNFAFDAFGPFPFIAAAAGAGIQQGDNTPPEWGQGWDSYGVRVASNYGILLITTSSRYALAEVLHEDTLYYRCACTGFFPRLGHALISTVTARRGADGHYMISLAAIGSPYAGTMAAAYGWYPNRFNASDGFRMGNYNLAVAAGQNVALEFIYGGPHTLLGHVRIINSMHRHTGDSDSTP